MMIPTAKALRPIPDKATVLIGAIQPATFKKMDEVFNIGCAIIAAHILLDRFEET